jgi:crossover junction endodeoxyribonuclease RuvC
MPKLSSLYGLEIVFAPNPIPTPLQIIKTPNMANTEMKITITIDPGKSGAIAIRWHDGKIDCHKFESESETVANLRSVQAAADIEGVPVTAILEKVHAMPGQGVTSMFSFGANYGFYRGVLQALQIPFEEVTPQHWQKGLGLPRCKGAERKRRLKQLACERYPALKPTMATADALLMLGI